MPVKDEQGEVLLPKLQKYLAETDAAPKIAPDMIKEYKKLFRHQNLGNLRNAPTSMVDIYNTATVKLMSPEFIKLYSSEQWNSFKAEKLHKGIVSVVGWARATGSYGKANKAIYDMPTLQFDRDSDFQRKLDEIQKGDYRLAYKNL